MKNLLYFVRIDFSLFQSPRRVAMTEPPGYELAKDTITQPSH